MNLSVRNFRIVPVKKTEENWLSIFPLLYQIVLFMALTRKSSLNIEIIHTYGPIHQQFNWMPKLTRSCYLFQLALLTLRSLVSCPLEVGVNTQLNYTHLTPSLSSFLPFYLSAGSVSPFCPTVPQSSVK